MKFVTKLNPSLCPLAIAHIRLLLSDSTKGTIAFQGLAYTEESGDIWHVASDSRTEPPFVNDWTDKSFGLAPAPKLTLASVRASLPSSMVIKKTEYGEYRVSFRVGPYFSKASAENCAYYTDCLSDALNTGLAMHKAAN